MAKRTKKSTQSNLPILIGLFVVLLLFGYVIFKNNQENSDVKGEQTITSKVSTMPLIKRDGNAGEACGRSINRACKKELICAPLGPAYKILNTTPTEGELVAEEEVVSSQNVGCIGKTEQEIKGGCLPYIPYYGACVKKGVWPPSSIKITPKLTPTSCVRRSEPCKETDPRKCPVYSPLPPGTVICTPTPTIIPDTPCSFNGTDYKNGETFKDDCNTCSCSSGRVMCTAIACETGDNPVVGLGQMCGGIGGIHCETGLSCDYGANKNQPDASGTCVKVTKEPVSKRPFWKFWD